MFEIGQLIFTDNVHVMSSRRLSTGSSKRCSSITSSLLHALVLFHLHQSPASSMMRHSISSSSIGALFSMWNFPPPWSNHQSAAYAPLSITNSVNGELRQPPFAEDERVAPYCAGCVKASVMTSARMP